MKKYLFPVAMLAFCINSFSQPTINKAATVNTDYLKKSKSQKTTAWVMLGGGAAFILIGDLIGNSKGSSFSDAGTGVVIAGIGVLSMIGSIPVFIASAKNKRRAMSMSFKNETMPQVQKSSFVYKSIPSLTLRISL